LSLWLNTAGAPGEIAARAGNCMRALHHVYTHRIEGREDLIGQQIEDVLDPSSSIHHIVGLLADFSNLYSGHITWGGWGSNPRPADYEKSGPAQHVRCLH
jgi:hypothetical protein